MLGLLAPLFFVLFVVVPEVIATSFRRGFLMANTKKSGSFKGKSNKLGEGGRAAQLKAQGVPGGVIGAIARSKGAAPGQKNFHKRGK